LLLFLACSQALDLQSLKRHHHHGWARAHIPEHDIDLAEEHENAYVNEHGYASEQGRLEAMSREELISAVLVGENDVQALLTQASEGPPSLSRVRALSDTENADVDSFEDATGNDNSGQILLDSSTGGLAAAITVDSSFMDLGGKRTSLATRVTSDETESVGMTTVAQLKQMQRHALARRPKPPAQQFAIIYALDADDVWWWYDEVFLPDDQDVLHSETRALNAGVFNEDDMPDKTVEVIIFSFFNPCTKAHQGVDSCKDLVIKPFLAKSKKSLTVMFYTWLGFSTQTGRQELGRYRSDPDLVKAAQNGRFQLALVTGGSKNKPRVTTEIWS